MNDLSMLVLILNAATAAFLLYIMFSDLLFPTSEKPARVAVHSRLQNRRKLHAMAAAARFRV